MNFLAHQYLSFENEPLMVGNFIADTVKGKELLRYPKAIQRGIRLHRFIDTFTDENPLPLQSRKRLYPYFGKYAAVVQDVFYDHFLASEWQNHHEVELAKYTARVYRVLERNRHLFNPRADRTFHYMKNQNWLLGYASREGIDRALKGLSNRARFASNMDKALPALSLEGDKLREDFRIFFPRLIEAVREGGFESD
jgi:acyl carrier protein phosphodiesterase